MLNGTDNTGEDPNDIRTLLSRAGFQRAHKLRLVKYEQMNDVVLQGDSLCHLTSARQLEMYTLFKKKVTLR